jgi:hypothetical protein
MYQVIPFQFTRMNSCWDKDELLDVMHGNSDRLLKIENAIKDPDFIELGVEDIRGCIYNEPSEVYARIERGVLSYIGIAETDVPESFFGIKAEEVK